MDYYIQREINEAKKAARANKQAISQALKRIDAQDAYIQSLETRIDLLTSELVTLVDYVVTVMVEEAE